MKTPSSRIPRSASLWLGLLAATCFAADETKEPPQTFAVKLGDQTVKVLEGEPAKLTGSFTNPQLTITPDPYRVFPYQGVRFEYPRTYSFAYEGNLGGVSEKLWTMSGDDVILMICLLKKKMTVTEFAEGLMDQFGRTNCMVVDSNARLTVGAHSIRGQTIRINIRNHRITQEVYDLPSAVGQTRLLVLQDEPTEKGEHSAEAKGVLETLKKSFQIDGK